MKVQNPKQYNWVSNSILSIKTDFDSCETASGRNLSFCDINWKPFYQVTVSVISGFKNRKFEQICNRL